jgi:hypothetical protein
VSFSRDFPTDVKQSKLAYFGACLDGWVLTMRSMEYLSKGDSFNPVAELSRADVRYNADASAGAMFIKRYKGDRGHQWPVKRLAHARGGKLCCLAVRLAYEEINPVRAGVLPASVPYWQQPDGRPITRARLQNYLQVHMTRMGAPAKLYKSHSLRKGGVTAMLAAGVPLPQIQLMARWVSPNMASCMLRSLLKNRPRCSRRLVASTRCQCATKSRSSGRRTLHALGNVHKLAVLSGCPE